MTEINYAVLREQATNSFVWSARSTHYSFLEMAGVDLHDYFLSPDAYAKAFCPANKKAFSEKYGSDVEILVHGPAILYGQLSAFGYDLVFPQGGEVNHKHLNLSIDECIDVLKRDYDYSKAGYYPQYHENLIKVREIMQDNSILPQYSTDGPLSLCYGMLGDAFFMKPYDEPEKFKEMLELITRQIISFRRWQYKNTTGIAKEKTGHGLYDDLAAMLSPALWDDFVLPYWNMFYEELCEHNRFIHSEDMKYGHLPNLHNIGITYYEPAISASLDPDKIREAVDMPFSWKLESFHYPNMSVQDVRDWVLKAVADGVSRVWTVVGSGMQSEEAVAKVRMFTETAKEVEEMFRQKISREEIGKMVSAEGNAKFWAKWPE